jgi:hypothetical protein
MQRSKTLLLPLVTFGLLALSAPESRADSFLFTLSSPVQLVPDAGGTITFAATVTNTDPTNSEYLNADSSNVDSPLTLDDSDFFSNFPFSLGPGESFTGDLFTVSVPGGLTPGLYTGSFEILGGTDPNDFTDTLGTASFNVNVTPEPSSLLLLFTGACAGAMALRRKHGSTAEVTGLKP